MDFQLKSVLLLISCCVQQCMLFTLGGTLADALRSWPLFPAEPVRRAISTLQKYESRRTLSTET